MIGWKNEQVIIIWISYYHNSTLANYLIIGYLLGAQLFLEAYLSSQVGCSAGPHGL